MMTVCQIVISISNALCYRYGFDILLRYKAHYISTYFILSYFRMR